MECEMQMKKYFVVQVMCPSLVTDFNQTCVVWCACALCATYLVSVRLLSWKAGYRRKSTLSFNKVPLIIGRFQQKLRSECFLWYLNWQFSGFHISHCQKPQHTFGQFRNKPSYVVEIIRRRRPAARHRTSCLWQYVTLTIVTSRWFFQDTCQLSTSWRFYT